VIRETNVSDYMIKMKKRTIGIIPARYASTRLPGKPLVDIKGKSLIQRVYEAVSQSQALDRIIIATDDERIAEECKTFNAEFVMTPSELPSGTDRVKFAYDELNENAEIIVNIQGDEPLLFGEIIDKMLAGFAERNADVATLIKKINSYDDLDDPSVVKVALGTNNLAAYFSRTAIPYLRDIEKNQRLEAYDYFKHIGIYAYKLEALEKFFKLPVSKLESAEKLEQLRLLESGALYYCAETDAELIGVDTPEDVIKVAKFF
jgi:3-deoxy-manno-octulosonate cytidylyltransferase (CMP-KDO synthetase)